MTFIFAKFRLLMWKNFLIHYRHPTQTVLEVMVPVLFSIIMIGIRSLVDPDENPNNTFYEPFSINTLEPLRLVFVDSSTQSIGPLNVLIPLIS